MCQTASEATLEREGEREVNAPTQMWPKLTA